MESNTIKGRYNGMNSFKCCLCGKVFYGYGNNPDPLNTNRGARCCDNCNRYVIYERMKRFSEKKPMREVS